MKTCLGCKYADWKKTDKGRLHPSGDGLCKYEWKLPAVPQSMYWIGKFSPSPYGGHINRKSILKGHCVYFARNSEK